MSGDEAIRAQRLSDRISYSLDTEISPPYPESWCARYDKLATTPIRSQIQTLLWHQKSQSLLVLPGPA